MAHRIVYPVKHAGKIHKTGQVVNWPADVTGDLVKLGALMPLDGAPAAEPEKLPETPAVPEKQPDSGLPAVPVHSDKPAKPEEPARPRKPAKK